MGRQDVFSVAVVIFTVSNIGAMGLELNLREALKDLRSIRAIGPFVLWGWMVGPALAWLIISLLPLSEGHEDPVHHLPQRPPARLATRASLD